MIFERRQNACKTPMKKPNNWSELKKKVNCFKHSTSIITEYEFNKIIDISKCYKNQNQINIFKKISIKVALK